MIKNAKSLMDKSKYLAEKNNITTNEILQNYMFERILERLSVSKYKNNFILKGGLLLSSIMGIDNRTTIDMDTCIKGINLTEEQLYEVLNEILNIDVNDGVKFEIKNSKPIKEDDDYGGLKYKLLAKFDNLRVNLSIDIATGDLITPREIEYDYKMMFEDRSLKIMTYNIEEQKKDTENITQSNIITEEDAIKKAKNILEEYGFKNEEIKTIEFENNIESNMALWKVKTESNIYIEFDARGGDYFNIDISKR